MLSQEQDSVGNSWGSGIKKNRPGEIFSEIIDMETLQYGISLYFGLNFLSHFRKKAETANLFFKSRS